MTPVPLYTILVLCVIIAFILADKKMVKESKQQEERKMSEIDSNKDEEYK